MEKLSLQWIAGATHGQLHGEPLRQARGVSTDSRTIRRGELFVALRGERFDGHRFLAAAAARGAAAAMVSAQGKARRPKGLPLIVVRDTLAALQALGQAYRRRRQTLKVVAVTGSNGKTTTKEAIATVMNEKKKVVKTQGNLNNHIGVPLSLLRAEPEDEVGIFELGINHPGEMPPLVQICQPQIGVLTNIGASHLEFFGDKETVAFEKGKLLEALPPDGLAVLNADDEWTPSLRARVPHNGARVTTVGFAAEADVRADNVRWEKGKLCFDLHFADADETPRVWLEAVGKHQIYSALFSAAVAREFGLTPQVIARGLAKLRSLHGRLQPQHIRGVRLLDDSYNANPDSMCAALESLASWPGARRRIALLGDMAELGAASKPGHRRVGEAAAKARLDLLFVVGPQARWIGEAAQEGGLCAVRYFDRAEQAGCALAQQARRGDAILVKASRAARLEQAIAVFRKRFVKKAK